jgi:large subunit ribosomal protein L29
MKAEELRQKTPAELRELLHQLREELFNLRYQVATNRLKQVHRIREVRKDIARTLTILREKGVKL